jgi:DDE superfamily endonuclease
LIPETLDAITECLKDYIKMPSTADQWKGISADFQNLWNFPLCLGALDGKHVLVEAPANSGSVFFNYKGTFSIVLLAMVDANYRFIFLDIGRNGRVGDAGIYARSTLKKYFESDEAGYPGKEALPNSKLEGFHAILGDSAFPLKNYLLKPYPIDKKLTKERRVFNYRYFTSNFELQ